MDWLYKTLLEPSVFQLIISLCLVSAIGIYLGRIKIGGLSLGITFVFFTGIIASHFGLLVNKEMLGFAQNFGLILFVYTLGVQVGPGFLSSFRKGGIMLNMMAFAVIAVGMLLTLILHWITDVSLVNMVGLLCGAVTNTPALGAAQQFVEHIPGIGNGVASGMALACAISYPLGVVGVIFAIVLMRAISPRSEKKEVDNSLTTPAVFEYLVNNPAVFDKKIEEVMVLTNLKFVISRKWRDGEVTIPTSDTVIREGDHLLINSAKGDFEAIKILFGEQDKTDWNRKDIDWNSVDRQLVSIVIVVTRPKLDGVKLMQLRLRNLYGVNITKVNRSGINLLASPNLRLQVGDKLTVVGERSSIDKVEKILGGEVKQLDNPNLLTVFIGILVGVFLGLLPIPLPGLSTPIKLGLAGGPMIVGILMGAFGPRFHMTTYMTQSANLIMRQFGIVIYLAGLGLDSGEHFFETLFRPEGLLWILIGFTITMVPILLVGIPGIKIFKLRYAQCVGLICGSMSNPMALDYANSTVDTDEPSVAYATVYPLSMFLRVISAQLIVMIFLK